MTVQKTASLRDKLKETKTLVVGEELLIPPYHEQPKSATKHVCRLKPVEIDRFWSNVVKTEACWIWTGSLYRGRGQFTTRGKCYAAPRISFELAYGMVPEGYFVYHGCGNRKCINPKHLFSHIPHHSENAKQKIRLAKLEDSNGNWSGDAVGLGGLHQWIKARKPKPQLCESCHVRPPYDLANVSGKYERDVNDYQWLCRKCHMEGDGRLQRLHARSQFSQEARI